MSIEDARSFIEKAKRTEAIQKAVNEHNRGVVDIGREHGHQFTKDELMHVLREHNIQPTDGKDDPDTCLAI